MSGAPAAGGAAPPGFLPAGQHDEGVGVHVGERGRITPGAGAAPEAAAGRAGAAGIRYSTGVPQPAHASAPLRYLRQAMQ